MKFKHLPFMFAAILGLGPSVHVRLEDVKVGNPQIPDFGLGHGGMHSTRAGALSVGARIRASQNGSWAMNSYHARRAAQQAELYADTPKPPAGRAQRRANRRAHSLFVSTQRLAGRDL